MFSLNPFKWFKKKDDFNFDSGNNFEQQPADDSQFNQQQNFNQPAYNQPSYSQPEPIRQQPISQSSYGDNEHQLIISKLSTVEAKLDNINERLKRIEKLAEQ
ncbi:hypothetical protein J4405_00150 [Candidatus Woesearchaeota archaeon]|nr:hypothetical protein [Candidatus Woesearchaeota archaeon]